MSVMRRREERGDGRARERWRRNFPPPSPYVRLSLDAEEEEGRWGREEHRERGRREKERENVGERERRCHGREKKTTREKGYGREVLQKRERLRERKKRENEGVSEMGREREK